MRLTKHEIILLAVIFGALAGGAVVRAYRQAHPPENQAIISLPERSSAKTQVRR